MDVGTHPSDEGAPGSRSLNMDKLYWEKFDEGQDPNKGLNLGHPVGFFFCRIFLPPQFLDTVHGRQSSHMMASSHSGFSLFTTTPFKDLVCGQSSSHWQRLRVSSYRGFFYHKPYQPHSINKVGVSFQTTPMGTITHTHSQQTGVDS